MVKNQCLNYTFAKIFFYQKTSFTVFLYILYIHMSVCMYKTNILFPRDIIDTTTNIDNTNIDTTTNIEDTNIDTTTNTDTTTNKDTTTNIYIYNTKI